MIVGVSVARVHLRTGRSWQPGPDSPRVWLTACGVYRPVETTTDLAHVTCGNCRRRASSARVVDVVATGWSGGWEISLEGEVVTQADRFDLVDRQVRDYLDTAEPGVEHRDVIVRVQRVDDDGPGAGAGAGGDVSR